MIFYYGGARDLGASASSYIAIDADAPTLSSATPLDEATAVAVDSDIVLNFSEPIAAGSGNILIKRSSDDTTVATISIADTTQISINGSTVTINPTNDLDPSTGYYLEIASGVIVDSAGNAYAGINDSATLNFTTRDTTAPSFLSAATNIFGNKVILTYDEVLNALTTAAPNDFTVKVGGSPVSVLAVTVNGATVELTLASSVTNGQAVTVAYTDASGNGANVTQDAAGNAAASLPITSVTNNVSAVGDTTAPSFLSAATNSFGNKVILTYDEALDALNTVAPNDFTVKVGGSPVSVLAVTVNGATVELTLASSVTNGQAVTVAYTDASGNGANVIHDAAGNDAASLPITSVTNNVSAVGDTTAPSFLSAATNSFGNKVILTYNEALDALNKPVPADFTVKVGGSPVSVLGVTVSDRRVLLTLASSIASGQAVTVAYTDASGNGANVIHDAAGNDAASLPDTHVSNNVTSAVWDTTAPSFLSAATNSFGNKVILTYNEALDALNTAVPNDFMVRVGGSAVSVLAVTVNGSNVELTLASPVPKGRPSPSPLPTPMPTATAPMSHRIPPATMPPPCLSPVSPITSLPLGTPQRRASSVLQQTALATRSSSPMTRHSMLSIQLPLMTSRLK